MGSGSWFKTIIRRKKVKVDKFKQAKECSSTENPTGLKSKDASQENKANGGQYTTRTIPSEDVAATRIQTAFRAYTARKTLRRMKGVGRFQKLAQVQSVQKQSTSTLTHLHTWSRIQAQVRERRQSMVIEGRLKQKKLANQMKLEAKLHGLEQIDWHGGSDTMEEILARIQHREDAAVKRERALAYAFTHQWRAYSGPSQGSNASELGKANWGWSWKERWIAARPWESRLPSQAISPNKARQNKLNKSEKSGKPLTTQKSVPVKKLGALNGKTPEKSRRLSFPGAEKPSEKDQEVAVKKRDSVS